MEVKMNHLLVWYVYTIWACCSYKFLI